MGLILDYWLADLSALAAIFFTSVYLYFKYSFSYWNRRGVETIAPSFPFGNVGPIFMQKSSFGEHTKKIYDQTVGGFSGIYFLNRPALLVKDPELVKSILVKDFQYFVDRGVFIDEKSDPLSGHLFSLGGSKWKNLRVKLTPTFTSGKLKAMFQTLVDSGEILERYVDMNIADKAPVEIKDILARFTTDIIATVAFGLQINSLENPDEMFRKIGRLIFKQDLFLGIRMFMTFIAPKLQKVFMLKTVKPEVEDFMMNVVKQTIEHREKNNVNRSDFMQLMIQLRNSGKVNEDGVWEFKTSDHKQMSVEEIAAQAYVFFLAGFETSSTTMAFCLHELSMNKDIQERTQRDIDETLRKHGGKLTYDSINDMKYLENVISETLRKYPSLPFLSRECNKDYKIPGTEVVIEKGTSIILPLLGLQRDPKHFPDPEKFDPDRFTESVKSGRHQYAYAPFGEGPRNCIGIRMGKMQTKVGLAVLLSKFNFEKCPGTKYSLPLSPVSAIMSPEDGMWMSVTHRKTARQLA